MARSRPGGSFSAAVRVRMGEEAGVGGWAEESFQRTAACKALIRTTWPWPPRTCFSSRIREGDRFRTASLRRAALKGHCQQQVGEQDGRSWGVLG